MLSNQKLSKFQFPPIPKIAVGIGCGLVVTSIFLCLTSNSIPLFAIGFLFFPVGLLIGFYGIYSLYFGRQFHLLTLMLFVLISSPFLGLNMRPLIIDPLPGSGTLPGSYYHRYGWPFPFHNDVWDIPERELAPKSDGRFILSYSKEGQRVSYSYAASNGLLMWLNFSIWSMFLFVSTFLCEWWIRRRVKAGKNAVAYSTNLFSA